MKPFRPFFLLAALDAVFGAAVWLPLRPVADALKAVGTSPADWHRDLLLFAMVPAMLSGFVLTALPRWTRRHVSPSAVYALIALSLLSRVCLLLLPPPAGLAIAALVVALLTIVAAGNVLAGGDRRNLKIVLLLAAFSGSAVAVVFFPQSEHALRSALASIIGLMLIIGGRVAPALTVAFAEQAGGRMQDRRSASLEHIAAFASACALAGWVVGPASSFTGVLCGFAAGANLLRAASWRGWHVRDASILALHVGYGWIIAGFVLLAAHILAPESVSRGAFVHAWTAGAIGTLGLAVMASMIRRHSGRPFARNALWTTSAMAISLAAILRLLAALSSRDPDLRMPVSAALWVAAFVLFVAAFRTTLLEYRSSPIRS